MSSCRCARDRAASSSAARRRLGDDAGAGDLAEDVQHGIRGRARCSDRLNDLLISGKSGTMLPITACSSTGQFCHDGSCAWQRRMRAVGARSRARPAPRRASLRPSRCPIATRRGSGSRRAMLARRAARRQIARTRRSDSSSSSKRTATRAATSPLRCAAMRTLELRRRARTESRSAGRSACPLARPASPVRPSCAASSGVDAAGADEAVLQRRRARRRCRAASRTSRSSASRTASRDALACAARRGRARRRPARRSPSASGGRTPRRLRAASPR